MRFLIIVIAAVFLVGCAAPTVMVNVPDIEKSSLLRVEDLRPATEKENKIFSASIFSEAYGTYRRGDELVNPNPVRLFQHKIFEKYSDTGDFPEVKVHHLVIYMNVKSELRKGTIGGFLGGVVGGAIAYGTQKDGIDVIARLTTEEEFSSFEEEYQRALYTKDENPDKISVYKVYLEAELDGKRTFVTTMTPTKLPKTIDKNPHAAAIETAMAYFLDQY